MQVDQTIEPYVPNELGTGEVATGSGSSVSICILIMCAIIGGVYYVLNEAIKRR